MLGHFNSFFCNVLGKKMDYTDKDAEILSRHVSSLEKDIYALKNLPPEVVSVLFAYVSRSPASFRDNLLKLLKGGKLLPKGSFKEATDYFGAASEKASAFHEKWVVGFGHSSVAEHAVVPAAIENVSILASKIIEDSRLAAFTEKSTRYQWFDRTKYLKPETVMNSGHGKEYERAMDSLFDFYAGHTNELLDFVKEKNPRPDSMNEKFYESISKARACDALRYTLPASTLTNIGMTANARTLEHLMSKMFSHPLHEVNAIAAGLKEECSKILPTLLKAAKKSDSISSLHALQGSFDESFSLEPGKGKDVELVLANRKTEARLLASLLYRFSNYSFSQCLRHAEELSDEEKRALLKKAAPDPLEQPPREFEHAYFTFDILVDYGAFRDIQRHRMCTQSSQLLSTDHGFSMPVELKEIGLEKEFSERMNEARELFESMREEMPFEAQYCVPLAFKKRVLFTWNLRELWHFIKLRSGKTGHDSYRKIAWLCFKELEDRHPLLAEFLKVTPYP